MIGIGLAVVVALGLALGAPLEVVVLGVVVVGIAHLVLEVRYVLGSYRPLLHGRFLLLANLALAGLVIGRLVWPGPAGRRVEVVVVASLIAAAGYVATHGRPWARTAMFGAVAGGAAVAFAHADGWFAVQAHLHNLVPAVFLWLWAGAALPPRRARAFRALTLLWVVVVPVVVLSGALDGWLSGSAPRLDGVAGAATQANVVASVVPPDLSGGLGTRLLALFAFAQVMHYAVWCWFFPRHGGAPPAAFASSPSGRVLHSRWVWLIVGAATAVVATLAWLDYRQGRTLYTSLGSYHAYLELPVLLAVLLGLRPVTVHPTPDPE